MNFIKSDLLILASDSNLTFFELDLQHSSMSSPNVLGILLSLLLLNNRFILSNGMPSHVFDDMDEEQWIPSYSMIKHENRKPSGIRRDEFDVDPPEVKEEDIRVVPEIEQRRLETIKNVDKLLDSSG